MSPSLVVLLLALLLGIQPITSDLYLPTLPAIASGFSATPAQTRLTLTVLLLAFGFSQLIWGPLSDRFGRRPVLLLGLGAYLLAAIGSVLAPSMALLVLWRALQGAAMGASVMCARAIVRDLYQPLEGARVMSRAFTGLGIIACACAPLGGLLADLIHWRAALAALAVFGAAALMLVARRYVETAPSRNPHALAPRVLFATWRGIVANPTFLAYTALSSATYCGLFTLLATSSFVFVGEGGMSRTGYGLLMMTTAVAYIAGTFVCRRLVPRLGVRRTVAVAGALSLAGGGGVALLAWLGVRDGWALIAPVWVFMVAHGIHQPCSTSGAVGPFPQAAGAASALNGFLQMAAAFLTGQWLGLLVGPSVFALAIGMACWGAMTALIAWTLVARHGDARAAS
ncbi:MAG: Bcr/CflA family efflux MFS transporter [Comamonadaceae bacterium]|nr:MAG: Bcr/CflA family efflux MFS transporter [Comamonadaceae bacterium]